MTTNKQEKKVEWEKKRVQRALDYHNKKYGTNIVIEDKTQNVRLDLKGKSDWDWVCYDTETDNEIAIEVKRLTDEKLEARQDTIWDVLEEIRSNLSNKLPGTFVLNIDIPRDYYLPISGHRNKQEFKKVLCLAIVQTEQRLKLEEEQSLIHQIIGQLPFALPNSFSCALKKVGDEGSALHKSSGVTGFLSRELDERELQKFKEIVSHANEQLSQATNAKRTILVIIEEGYRITYPDTVAKALEQINHDSYSHIDHIYYVSGEGVTEIPLPAT